MKHLLPRLGALILLLGLMMPATVNAQETEPPTRPLLLDFTVDMNFTIDEGIFNPDTDQLFYDRGCCQLGIRSGRPGTLRAAADSHNTPASSVSTLKYRFPMSPTIWGLNSSCSS